MRDCLGYSDGAIPRAMKLYFAPRTRSVRPRWLLEELEVPYQLLTVKPTKQESPLGEFPVLIDGELTLFEATATCLYLADRFPEKRLAPALSSPDRGPYLQWLLFAQVELEPVVLDFYRNAQLPEVERQKLTRQQARLDEVLAVLDERLGAREFAVGESFTAADLVIASILHLVHTLKLLERHPKLFEYTLRHCKRPGSLRAVTLP